MSPEWFEKQNERYRYVTEYNRDNRLIGLTATTKMTMTTEDWWKMLPV